MSGRLEAAQLYLDGAVKAIGKSDMNGVAFLTMLAVDQLISEIRELRIEVGK